MFFRTTQIIIFLFPHLICLSLFSQCIKKDQITYGGEWDFSSYINNCPTYQFTYSGDTSTTWNYLCDPIDIKQASKEVLRLKKFVDGKIRSYAGAKFFSKVNFNAVEVVYPDSLQSFIDNGRNVSLIDCKAKYFFYYEFKPDTISNYHIGIALNKKGEIMNRFNFPAEKDYKPFDSSFTYCKIIAIARRVQKNIDPIKEISLQYDSKLRRFYWLIVQELVNDKPGRNSLNTVSIDAIDLKRVTLSRRTVYVDY
jgi:hypothetical protein